MNKKYDIGEKPSLKQVVYDNLQKSIIQGELKPGSRLTEDELTQAMNISRAPIREALNMLDRDGFVKIIPRKGVVVADVTLKDIIDIWNCRLALEPFAAREAFHNIPEEKIRLAMKHIEELKKEPSDFTKYMESDLEVHELYYCYLDNEYMKTLLFNMKKHSMRMRWLEEKAHRDMESIEASIKEHELILEAMLGDFEELVFYAVQRHISNSAERLKNSFD